MFLVAVITIPIGLLYAIFELMWGGIYSFFTGVSKMVSVTAGQSLNRLLINPDGFPFGTHSVSAVLGANQRDGTLSSLGVWLSNLLDSIDKDHCKKAAERADI